MDAQMCTATCLILLSHPALDGPCFGALVAAGGLDGDRATWGVPVGCSLGGGLCYGCWCQAVSHLLNLSWS